MRSAFANVLSASGQTVWIFNRALGADDGSGYGERVVTLSSGTVTATITAPNQKDVWVEPGYYIEDYKQFHVASGAIIGQYDFINPSGSGDYFIVTAIPQWKFQGEDTHLKVMTRRQKRG